MLEVPGVVGPLPLLAGTMPQNRTAAPSEFALWVAAGLLLFSLLMRAQTFGNPILGYDEQFYRLVGARMWAQHALPYVDIFDRKPIGLFLIYAATAALGGGGVWQYQLVATGFAAATAWVIWRAALRIASHGPAVIAACLYVLWLNCMEGEGGQAQVFYNLPMAAAGLLVWRLTAGREKVAARGCWAMLLVGVAIQIKYTALYEGVFLGLALVWALRRQDRRWATSAVWGLAWIGCALTPTAIAALAYWHMGALQAFVFANFISPFGTLRDPWALQVAGLRDIAIALAPLLAMAAIGTRRAQEGMRFVWLWLAAALVGMLLFGCFRTPQYAMAALVPLSIAVAPFFAGIGMRSLRWLVLLAALVVSQWAVWRVQTLHSGADAALLRAARPAHGCMYVYAGYPALYQLEHSCLPTRWVFPAHLDSAYEASAKALGIAPLVEERRILARRPDVIVDELPSPSEQNRATHAVLAAVLQRDYRLALQQPTGPGRYLMVYRRKDLAALR